MQTFRCLFAGRSGQPDGLMDEMPTVVVQPLRSELAKVPLTELSRARALVHSRRRLYQLCARPHRIADGTMPAEHHLVCA